MRRALETKPSRDILCIELRNKTIEGYQSVLYKCSRIFQIGEPAVMDLLGITVQLYQFYFRLKTNTSRNMRYPHKLTD